MIFIVCCNFINSFFLLILFLFPFCYLINGAFLIAHLLFCILRLMFDRTNACFMNIYSYTRNSMGRGSVNIKPSFIISQCEVTNGDYVNKR